MTRKGVWKIGVVVLLSFSIFWVVWGADSARSNLPFWQKEELVSDKNREKTDSFLALSLMNTDITTSTVALKVRIENDADEHCSVDRRFLLNVKLKNQWYHVPLRELTEEEKRDAHEEQHLKKSIDNIVNGGVAKTNSLKGLDFFVEVPSKGEVLIDFPISETYRSLKRGSYRLGVRQRGEDCYTMLEFEVK